MNKYMVCDYDSGGFILTYLCVDMHMLLFLMMYML